MEVRLREPDNIIEDERGSKTPVWLCPRCNELKRIEEFGWRYRGDAYPNEDIWNKQSHCTECRSHE